VRIKYFVVTIVVYQLVISLCVVQAAFFVWLIEKFFTLEGAVLSIVSGAIIVGLLIFNIRYIVPALRDDALGISSSRKKPPAMAVYFDILSGSMLGTFFVMMFVEEFFSWRKRCFGVSRYWFFHLFFLVLLFVQNRCVPINGDEILAGLLFFCSYFLVH